MLRGTLLAVLLSVSVMNFSGCIFLAAGAAGVGTAKWLSDKVTQPVDRPIDKVTKSSRAVLADMGATISKETDATDVVQILARDSQARQLWVDLRPLDANNTSVSVRVGYGNGTKDAQAILDNIAGKSRSWL